MPQKQPKQFYKYSQLVFQMGIIIGLSAWGGQKLDSYYKISSSIFTIVLSLAGIAIAFYIVFKDLMKNED